MSQTITHGLSFVSNAKFFQPIKLLTVTTVLGFLLASCATNTPKQTRPTQVVKADETLIDGTLTAKQYLEQAQEAAPEVASKSLVKASQLYLVQKSYIKALWLANQSKVFTSEPSAEYSLTMVKAQALYQLNEIELATEQLQSADLLKQNNALQHQHSYYTLLANIQRRRDLPVAAIAAQLYALSFNDLYSETELKFEIEQLWQQLTSLSEWQVQQLVKQSPPNILGWQQLLNFAHRFGHQPSTFSRYLVQWQRSFPTHPAQIVIPTLQNSAQQSEQSNENIAIILPLSGSRSTAGKSAQQGILAAYANNENKTLHFIDSHQLDMASLPDKFEQLAIDYVIGPLLKPQVNAYLAQTEINVPTLLLNVPENSELPPRYVALSMRPEEQAIQAATTLSSRNYKHPIIFSHQDQVSQRITSTFVKQWLKSTGDEPEVIFIDRDAEMQKELKESFDVDLSEKRIKDLQFRIKSILKIEARNRRDIDMIYLVGSSKETRLLKPYIDVNTSQFSSLIPVFASSRSHSDKADKSDSRDLTGLVFTEMPWLLPSKQQNKSLKKLNKQLWPQKSDGLQRIFAMGYDSLTLIDKLESMKNHAYVRHYGQTGVLQLNPSNILTRSLLWGSYQKDKVEQIAME